MNLVNYGRHKIPIKEKDVLDRFETQYDTLLMLENNIEDLPSVDNTAGITVENNRVVAFGCIYFSLKTIPEYLQDLEVLKILYLPLNRLSVFPKVILKFSLLERLELTTNKIREIPESILQVKNLKFFDIRFNPLDTKSEELLSRLKKKGVEVLYEPVDY